MLNALQSLPIWLLLVVATTLEVSGDATVRVAIYRQSGSLRVALIVAGGALLLGYAAFLNFAPVEFDQVVGLYIATLFVVWQLISFVVFRTMPTGPILVGGALIVAGGLLVTFWRPS